MSLAWIIVAALIILNLLIALMADSYGGTMDSSELASRLEKARFMTQHERAVSSDKISTLSCYSISIKYQHRSQSLGLSE